MKEKTQSYHQEKEDLQTPKAPEKSGYVKYGDY
jgi:hypothetical protein